MLCEGCQSTLKVTSSVNSQPTAFLTSFKRIQDCAELAEYGKCFLCAVVLREIKSPGSAFHAIYEDVLRAEENYREQRELWLSYSVELDFRPLQDGSSAFDTVFRIRWWFGNSKRSKYNALTLYFSPIHRDQMPDHSTLWKVSSTSKPVRKFQMGTTVRLTRRLHSTACPHCHAMNIPLAHYAKSESDEEFEEGEEEEYHTTMRDGFGLYSIPNERYRCDNTGSEESAALIRQWMDFCESQHSLCPKRNPGPEEQMIYPTRLLDLGPSDILDADLRLVVSDEEDLVGRYVTLSHCWGNYDHIKLTSENLDKFKEEIKFSSLSKTFQDSVMVTRRLGIRFLWIDSLCIIQTGKDAKDDWLYESAKMYQVYKYSFLNIGATGAMDGSQGCFQQRDYEELFRPIITKPECWTHFEEYRQPYRLIEKSFLTDQLLREPLLQRGWVFQERFLSPRMLHFGSKQLFWECCEWRACESFPEYLVPPVLMASLNELRARKRTSERYVREREAKERKKNERRRRKKENAMRIMEIVDDDGQGEKGDQNGRPSNGNNTNLDSGDQTEPEIGAENDTKDVKQDETGAEASKEDEDEEWWDMEKLNLWAQLINIGSSDNGSVSLNLQKPKKETAEKNIENDSDSDSKDESTSECADEGAEGLFKEVEKLVKLAQVHTQWYQIILEYTSKQISREEDKLVALSGVAREYAELDLKNNNTYWAGIWACDVPRGLLWKTGYREARRPNTWRAPSWSWASVEGAVYPPIWSEWNTGYNLKLTHVFDLKAKYILEDNMFGAIESGRIRMKGQIIEIQAMMGDDGDFVFLNQGYEIEGSRWYPDETPSDSEESILCLSFISGRQGLYGMTVAKIEGEHDEYIRTGVFSIVASDTSKLPQDWIPPFPPFWDLQPIDEDAEDDDLGIFYLM